MRSPAVLTTETVFHPLTDVGTVSLWAGTSQALQPWTCTPVQSATAVGGVPVTGLLGSSAM